MGMEWPGVEGLSEEEGSGKGVEEGGGGGGLVMEEEEEERREGW